MSTLSIKELSHPAGEVIKIASGKTLDLKSQGSTTLPTGSVLQVQSGILTATYSQTASDWGDIGLSVTITPSSTSSKILISLCVALGMSVTGVNVRLRLVRGSTMIGSSTDLANSGFSHKEQNQTGNNYTRFLESFTFLDSPSSTSAQTYKVQLYRSNTAGVSYINRGDTDQSRQQSHITVQEIQG
tara:strand:+ start:71 stop:628 length:558 start_codon:yes stop_codon:yes gene_type:complete